MSEQPNVLTALKFPLSLAIASGFGCIQHSLLAEPVQWERLAFPVSESVWAASHADLEGDGKEDLIAVGETRVWVISDVMQKRRLREIANFEEGKLLHAAPGDFDGDGDLDLLLGRQISPWIEYRENGSTGSEPAGPDFTLAWLENPGRPRAKGELHVMDREIHGVHGVWTGDADGDGKTDAAATSFSGPFWKDSVAFFRNLGNDRFEREFLVTLGEDVRPHYLDAADLDGDGLMEFAMGAPQGNSLTLWKRGPDGWRRQLVAAEKGATNARFADMNGDGSMDLVGANGHGKGVFWYESPTWIRHDVDPEFPNCHALTVGDFDGDGRVDVASGSFTEKEVRWYRNGSDGRFTRYIVDTGNEQMSYDLKTAEMNGDGRPDLILGGRHSKNAVVYFNHPHDLDIESVLKN